jgi:hypothetical protein
MQIILELCGWLLLVHQVFGTRNKNITMAMNMIFKMIERNFYEPKTMANSDPLSMAILGCSAF